MVEKFKIEAPTDIDYEKEGMMCGLEFHQQLLAPYDDREISKVNGSKLFCSCPALLREDDAHFTINRQFRAVSGETGDIDISAQFEKLKQAETIYEGFEDTNCLIELDEEPIFPINEEALYRSLAISKKIFGLELVDELLISRKTIIDGSNTSGFQRTSQIAYISKNSFIEVDGKKIGIYQANLEEDSAKNVGREGNIRKFRLDRLGIPLIEIATSPDIRSPEESMRTAARIGELLRTTGFVKRGQGTIRQDLNVSIKKGTRIEIKGVSELDLLPTYVHNESVRQLRMVELLNILRNRGFGLDSVDELKSVDLTKLYKNTEAKFVKTALKKKQKVIGTILPKMKGLINYELQTNYRLGTEISEIAKVIAGVGGILHSDELPKYGISQEEVDKTNKELKLTDDDGFFLVIGPEKLGRKAIEGVKSVLTMWMSSEGLIPEVRAPRADGTTGYLRPLPGKARMYPETDIKPILLSKELLKRINDTVFEMPEDRVKRYKSDLKISDELAQQLSIHPQNTLFEELATSHKVEAKLVANTILSTFVDLRRQDYAIEKVTTQNLHDIFEAIAQGEISKSSIEDLLIGISKAKKPVPIKNHIDKLGLKKIEDSVIRDVIIQVIEENASYLNRGMGAMKPLMGKAMGKLGGKADGKTVSAIVKEELMKRI